MKRNIRSEAGTILLPHWLRRVIYVVTIILALTGITWIIAHYFMARDDYGGPNPLEPLSMKVHGAIIMPSMFLYGSLLRSHIIKAWKAKMNRSSGLIALSVLTMLTLSGYLLYYFGNDNLRPFISIFHWIIGLALLAALPLHIAIGRKASPHK